MNKIELIDKYKDLLDSGSNEGLRYNDPDKSRYVSFKHCLEFLSKRDNADVLELGTSRSFVDGKFEGCNMDDHKYWDPNDFSKWDWGAGCFTLIFGTIGNYNSFTTVDLIDSHLRRCKIFTRKVDILLQQSGLPETCHRAHNEVAQRSLRSSFLPCANPKISVEQSLSGVLL